MANRDGEGVFLRDDGQEIPAHIKAETEAKCEAIHEDLNKFAREDYPVSEVPRSVGHYFDDEFSAWLKEKEEAGEDSETLAWRRQFYDWWIRWEECDAGEVKESASI